MLNSYAMSLGESVSSGPFFKAYVANLLPGQFVQPFVDAAFSDLGLDPNVLLPSQRTDPQTGQPGTPRCRCRIRAPGRVAQPQFNLPDAITGNPGDPRYPAYSPGRCRHRRRAAHPRARRCPAPPGGTTHTDSHRVDVPEGQGR